MWAGVEQGGEIGCVDVEVLASVRGRWARRVAAPVHESERPACPQRRKRSPRSRWTRAAVDQQNLRPFPLADYRNRVHGRDGKESGEVALLLRNVGHCGALSG